MFLSSLEIGEKAKVTAISDDKSIDRQRLYSLGIIEGTEVESLCASPFGNPKAYLIRGTVFALRTETAEKITVEKI